MKNKKSASKIFKLFTSLVQANTKKEIFDFSTLEEDEFHLVKAILIDHTKSEHIFWDTKLSGNEISAGIGFYFKIPKQKHLFTKRRVVLLCANLKCNIVVKKTAVQLNWNFKLDNEQEVFNAIISIRFSVTKFIAIMKSANIAGILNTETPLEDEVKFIRNTTSENSLFDSAKRLRPSPIGRNRPSVLPKSKGDMYYAASSF
jgi:hypothetical protein